MGNNGFCKAYRKAWKHEAFKDLLEASIWNFLYQNACYDDCEIIFNGQIFNLKRGQIVITPRFLANGFRTTESSVRRLLKRLSKLHMIETQATTKATIVSVCKYSVFQSFEKSNDDQTTIKRRSNDANNKEEKEIKKKRINILFDEFWNLYALKKDKKKCSNRYKLLLDKGINHQDIIDGVKRYQDECSSKNTELKFIKNPLTFLNGECWLDEYDTRNEKPTKSNEEAKKQLQALMEIKT